MPQSSVTILAYHRIALPGSDDLSPTLIDAYPHDFEAQMRYLARYCNVVSLWDVVRALREGHSLPRRAVAITFDDGYDSFRDQAMPVLRRLGLPVTLFVATGFTGNPGRCFWWDDIYRSLSRTLHEEIELPGVRVMPLRSSRERLAAYERVVSIVERSEEAAAKSIVEHIIERCGVESGCASQLLGWDEVQALANEGVAIGPHTRSHAILAQASAARVREEVEGSWADLRAHIADPLPIFCYPNGQPYAVNRTAVATVKQAGMAGAVTMVAGLNVIGKTNPFLLYRTGAVAGESLNRFRLKINTAGRIYRRLKSIARPTRRAGFDL
jgi:peptidoglycan/xylan/chitin deacetylase (PgdA/CDA1 family)